MMCSQARLAATRRIVASHKRASPPRTLFARPPVGLNVIGEWLNYAHKVIYPSNYVVC